MDRLQDQIRQLNATREALEEYRMELAAQRAAALLKAWANTPEMRRAQFKIIDGGIALKP